MSVNPIIERGHLLGHMPDTLTKKILLGKLGQAKLVEVEADSLEGVLGDTLVVLPDA